MLNENEKTLFRQIAAGTGETLESGTLKMFSDLNNLEVVTTTSEKYADSFGFTEGEVLAALDEYGLAPQKQQIRDWYDGFTFGSKRDIYNPWSIINFLDKKKVRAYWANTRSNRLASRLLMESSEDTKKPFEDLLEGGVLKTQLDEQNVYNQLSTKKMPGGACCWPAGI